MNDRPFLSLEKDTNQSLICTYFSSTESLAMGIALVITLKR